MNARVVISMNIEIERAYIAGDIDATRAKIAEAGFVLARKESQMNLYLDHSFLHLIENKKYIRVRWIDGWSNAEITFSHPAVINSLEIRPQHSIHKKTRRSTENVLNVLKGLGFYEALIIEKERELFTIDRSIPAVGIVHVELDSGITIHSRNIDDIPRAKHHDVRIEDTVQVCIEFDSNGSAAAAAGIDRVAGEIGLSVANITTKNYFDRYFEA